MSEEEKPGQAPSDPASEIETEAEGVADAAVQNGEHAEPETEPSPEEQLAAAEAQAAENWDQFLRAQAEMENLRRRAQRDVENARKFALEKFAKELLGVKDSLEMGLNAAREGDAPDIAKLIEGTDLTLKQLGQAFEKNALIEIDPVGEKFNPERHEAMAMQASTEHEPNTVMTVVQKGYTLNERLIRPAMVLVAKAAEPSDAS